MPSQQHEVLVELFRNRPRLAPELLQVALHVELPEFTDANIESADLTDLKPAELRADLVVLLREAEPVLGIVVEVQLSPNPDKLFTWPAYSAGLRSRFRCPACVLVVCADDAVARWCAKTIDVGPGHVMTPFVVGPAGVPAITDVQRATADPELAVLSVMAHGKRPDVALAAQIAGAALHAGQHLPPDRSLLYFDMVMASLSEAARKALADMDLAKYEFQSEFAKRYVNEGRQEGRAEGRQEGRAEGRQEGQLEGRAAVVLKQLALRFKTTLPDSIVEKVRSATIDELDSWAERLLGAESLDDVFR